MGCCGSKQEADEPYHTKPRPLQSTQKKMVGKGVVIGGGQPNEQQTSNQNDKIAEAAEKRLQAYEKRGMNQQSQFEYELKKKKLEEAEQYEKERRGENYNLRWN